MGICVSFASVTFHAFHHLVDNLVGRCDVFRPHCKVILAGCGNIRMAGKLLDNLYRQMFCPVRYCRPPQVVKCTLCYSGAFPDKRLPVTIDKQIFYQSRLKSANVFSGKNKHAFHRPSSVLFSKNFSSSFFKYHTGLAS